MWAAESSRRRHHRRRPGPASSETRDAPAEADRGSRRSTRRATRARTTIRTATKRVQTRRRDESRARAVRARFHHREKRSESCSAPAGLPRSPRTRLMASDSATHPRAAGTLAGDHVALDVPDRHAGDRRDLLERVDLHPQNNGKYLAVLEGSRLSAESLVVRPRVRPHGDAAVLVRGPRRSP